MLNYCASEIRTDNGAAIGVPLRAFEIESGQCCRIEGQVIGCAEDFLWLIQEMGLCA